MKDAGAVFGAAFGLEIPLWFAPKGSAAVEDVTFRRSNAHGPVGEECRAVRSAVGMIETTGYAKYEFSGPGAEAFLSRMLTNRMPEPGRIVLAPMLNAGGKLIGDFTVARLADSLFNVFGSGVAEEYHMRWWEAHAPATGVAIRSLRSALVGLSIAGPNARELLARVTDVDLSNAAFPFMCYRRMDIGMIPATVGRLTFTGDLGYEIWVTPDYHVALYELLLRAGDGLGLRHVGMRALNSLRLEKSWGTWAREFRPIYTSCEAGLDRFVNLNKGEFIGRDAVLRHREAGPERRLVTLVVDDAGADAVGDEPVRCDDRTVGWITSGGFTHSVGKSVALGYVEAKLAEEGATFDVEIIGERRPARLAREPLFDPAGHRMRS
jgi:dimethylglycine dehydrogenase